MEKEIRILILDDFPARLILIEAELQIAKVPFISKVIKTRDDFVREVDDFAPDLFCRLIIFQGLLALRHSL